jgi:hypothetical protein
LLSGSNPFIFKFISYPVTSPQPGETIALGFNCASVLINNDNEEEKEKEERNIVTSIRLWTMMIFIFVIIM